MKQKLFLMSLAAIAMASCSKDETVNTNTGRAIDFRGAVGTRATEMTTEGLNSFYVTAIDEKSATYFENAEFEKSEGNTYISTPAYYWPGSGSLSFYAYSPSVAELGSGTLTINGTEQKLADYAPAAEIANQKDFITANATGDKATNETSGVQLDFAHRLAQIEVKAMNNNDGYIYKVTGVRIGQPVSSGTFNFANSEWSLGSGKTNYQVEYTGAKELSGTAVSIMGAQDDNAMLIPQKLTPWNVTTDATNSSLGAYLAVKVQIETKDGARVYPVASGVDYDWVAVPISTTWEAGKKYVYTLDFSAGSGNIDPEKPEPVDPEDPYEPGDEILGEAIKFTVEVADWTPSNETVEM